ncbi:Dynein heavy chain, cytoplasmic-like Protein [Tribolium castaneum]|uniref:Dynein heavy chain, cytoplasmic-like Protein n=1 Tax=Tribolium castaneum TaxID=7070 RepID=D6W7K6_TRICA|nr:Dynein heavy chain, cytoplasmic-like Protein [Tribolium castaneum]
MQLKRRHRIMLYMNKIVKKKKSEERSVKVAPLHHIASADNNILEFCRNCPSTAMSRFQEKDILKKVDAKGLEHNYPVLLNNIMAEAREEFLKVTQQSGVEMKLKTVKKQFRIEPYKHLGRTKNYSIFLQRRKELRSKFILHHPLIRRILNECVTKLPYELFNLHSSLKCQLDTSDFQKHIFDYANDAAQRLQEFYRKIVVLVEHEKVNTQRARSYLGACTGLLSVNISRTIAHTLLHVVSFTGSKEHIPYLKLNITFKDRLILQPTADDIIEIYNKFLRKIIDSARQFYVLEKYKIKGFDNKQIHLCLTDHFFNSILDQISRNIKQKYEPILNYIKNLDDKFVDIYTDLCSGGNTISTSDLIFDDGCKKLLYFKSYLPKVAFIPDNAYFTIGQLIITEYREIIKRTLLNIVENIFNSLSAQHEWENNDICEAFDIIYMRATQKPTTTEELIEIGKYMAWVRTEYLDELKERVMQALTYLTKLIQLGPLNDNHIILNAKAINWLDAILPILEENSTTFEQLKFEAEEKLQKVIEDINVDIKDVYPLLDILDSMDNIQSVRGYLNTITLHMVKIKKIEAKIDWINREEVSLSFPKSAYSEFDDLKNYVYPFYHLLKLCLDVQRNISVWLDGQFDLINYSKVKEKVEKYLKDLLRTQKVYRSKLRQAQDENLSLRFKGTVDDPDMLNWPAPLKLCSKAIKLIQDFEPSLAVIKIMCNEALMKRHWKKMSKVAGFDVTPNAGTTLRKIIEIDLTPNIDKYDQISFSATKERELLLNLEAMLQEWTDVNFTTQDHKQIQIITQMEDIEVVADDHIIKVINMLNSIYVKPYDNQVKDFYNKLLQISKTIQECRQAQQQWLHFFPLFLCHEITIQMSAETEVFKQITNTYTNYIQMIQTQPNVYTTVNSTNMLQDLVHCNEQFEFINQGVSLYFGKIRRYFPRFYFVSNDEMFRILSLTKDPTKIHRFIKSLFYEIRDLRFNENFVVSGIANIRSLLIALANNRDIITDINHSQITSDHDFKWLSHLRYYLSEENVLTVKIFDTEIKYGYEYLGTCDQIVVTPETERCYHTLILAYKHHLCVNTQGPTGSGKTESAKSLAKALAVQCTFFNCSQPIKLEVITEFLKGVASNGSWLVLEEFEKIQLDVCSILSQEIFKISTALKGALDVVVLNSTHIDINKCFICCTMTRPKDLPESFKILFRPLALTLPDIHIIAQVSLLSSGYESSVKLGRKIVNVHSLMRDLLPLSKLDFGLRAINEILNTCARFFCTEKNEEEIVDLSIRHVTIPKLSTTEMGVFDNILRHIFPSVKHTSEVLSVDAVTKVCQNLSLSATKPFVCKVLELKEIKRRNTGVIIVGLTMTGKTTLVRVLQATFGDKKIEVKILNAKTLSLKQLYGGFDGGLQWSDGIITKYLREDAEDEDWIVVDGSADPSLADNLNTVLDENRKLCLSSGEVLHLTRNKWIFFELENLGKASPAMISRCGIIYMNSNVIGWQPLVTSWLQHNDFEFQKGYEENFTVLFDWVIAPCLEFVRSCCHQLCKLNEIGLVKTTIQVLEMLLVEAYEAVLRKDEDVKNLVSWIQASFIQAVIWGVGSNLDLNSRQKFDEFFKQLWRGQNKSYPYPSSLEKVEVNVPADELIFDHSYLYKSKGNWKFWPDVLKNEKIEESDYLLDLFVPTNDTIKYTTIINLHITHNYPLLLNGPSGTGKSSCISDVIMNKIDKNLYEPSFLTFTATTTPNATQQLILSKLFKKKSGRYGPSEGKKCILCIEDLSEPIRDDFGCQPTLELIRELFDHKKWFHLDNFKPLCIDNVNVVASMTNNQDMCQRFLRHFNVFSINSLQEDSVLRIFSNVLLTKWKKIGFPSDIIGTVSQIVASTFHFYKSVLSLRPTLDWNFYYFNMRNFSRVIQVCSMIRKESADTNKKLFLKLWAHEIVRILGDRLLDKDQEWLFGNIKFCVEEHFKEDFGHLFENLPKNEHMEPDLSKILFGTYGDKGSTCFDETDICKLKEIATNCLREYNRDNLNKIDLVLFDHALEHLSKICRILSIPYCNLIQVGMCGTGRQTLVKLACLIMNQNFFKIEITEKYKLDDWHRTVKAFLKEAGGYGRPCTFFLKEGQIVIDTILDDLNYLLKSGEIPFIYSLEEKQELLDVVRASMQEEQPNIDESSESIFLYHQKRCKENLHIIFSFNSANSKFRDYIKQYSSLRKFCEINYLKKWPKEALESIAKVWIQDLNINDETKSKVVNAFSYFHQEGEQISNGVHVTPGSYLEFIRLYVDLVNFKQKKIQDVKQRYLAALEKLSFAALQISEMQKSLADYQPQLEAMTVKAIEMAKQIETETNEVEKASNLVKKDEATANEQAAAAQILKLDCEADLAQAIPILEDAISALNTLKPTDITLVKSMKNPPDAIKLVMAAVCVIKDVKPDRIPDPSTGRKIIDYWGPSKRILGDMNFLQTLKDFDKDNIKPEIMVKIRKDYLPHKDFKPHTVAKASSAAEGLCKWIIAMDMYDKVAKEVAPKKEKLEKAEREYGVTMAILNEKKEQVTRIEQKLADLNALLKEATRKQQKLQRDVDICKKKLNRAQKLIGGLSEEKIRWTNAVEHLEKQDFCLPGDMLLSSALIAYLGPFKCDQRQATLSLWVNYVRENEILFKEDYRFIEAFEKDLDYDRWHLNGLPTDNFFLENGIIGKFAKRWVLYIDPQNQANTWIKINEKQNGVRVTKFTCPEYMTTLKECVTTGTPLLIENVDEVIKPFLVNLMTKTTFFKNENEFIDIGGHVVEYNQKFVLYMTTDLKFPKYGPEIYDKLTIVDFGMTRFSLDEHLLTCVVEVEKPTLKRLKKTLNTERKRNKDALYNIEERILKTLSESTTDILEDEAALQILDESKILSKSIQQKQEALMEIEITLKTFRAGYETVSKHATNLYFTSFQLAKINHMYQFSYKWFIEVYSESIQKAQKFKDLAQRRASLIETLTYELYCKISRGIFERDKLLFSFLLCTNLLVAEKKIRLKEIELLVNPDVTAEESVGPGWLPQKIWHSICSLNAVVANFPQFFAVNQGHFRKIFESAAPENEFFPNSASFTKLLILSRLRPDRLNRGITQFVSNELGDKYVKPPFFDIGVSFIESHILSPLVFITQEGSDPISSLLNFAKTKHFDNKLTLNCIKSGQEDAFEAVIDKGKALGLWVCLQNCHLLTSYLPLLDLKLEEIDYSNTHENFRLWLTTNETDKFPISLLERSVRVTKEAPNPIKRKITNLFLNDPINCPRFFNKCPGRHEIFVRLLYSLTFLHCVLEERNKFGPYGWNVLYKFTESDFLISIEELQWIINNRPEPLEEIVYCMEKCTYGGYVSNEVDKRLFGVVVRDFLSTSDAIISLPYKTDFQDCINHIEKLPDNEQSEIFGLHENYESVRGLGQSKLILKSIRTVFNDMIYERETPNISSLVKELLEQIPPDCVSETKTNDSIVSLLVMQEIKYYKNLLNTIQKSLQDLQKVVDRSSLMTDNLEQLCHSLMKNETPVVWLQKSHSSSRSVSSFVKDLIRRIDYFKNFSYALDESVWLGGFFNPKAFLTAIKIAYSKEQLVPVDEIFFQIKSVCEKTDKSVVVDGLHLIGASWDEKTQCLNELSGKVIQQALPPVLFVFTINCNELYKCPLYKSANDFHGLENSSNFINPVLMHTDRRADHWIRRGTALLCHL